MSDSSTIAKKPPLDGVGPSAAMGGLGALAGLGAILASSCCVVPSLLGMAGLGGAAVAVQDVGIAASLQPYLLGAAGLMIGAAWLAFLRNRRRVARACASGACARRAAPWITGGLLSVATAAVLLAMFWGRLEPHVLQWLLS